MSLPLNTEATVNLMRKRPMSSLLAHVLGSAIIMEFVIIFSLGVSLLYLTCKCAILLSSTEISENVSHFSGCCSTPSLLGLRSQSSNFRQRSRRVSEIGESSTAVNRSSPSTSEPQQQIVVPSFTTLAIDKEQSSIM
ncbi:hypothetical protein K1719_039494 [Acacia pycnantha]|nr:hypothetical protein K1719_039494 [Acacia pycnantha]